MEPRAFGILNFLTIGIFSSFRIQRMDLFEAILYSTHEYLQFILYLTDRFIEFISHLTHRYIFEPISHLIIAMMSSCRFRCRSHSHSTHEYGEPHYFPMHDYNESGHLAPTYEYNEPRLRTRRWWNHLVFDAWVQTRFTSDTRVGRTYFSFEARIWRATFAFDVLANPFR